MRWYIKWKTDWRTYGRVTRGFMARKVLNFSCFLEQSTSFAAVMLLVIKWIDEIIA